MPTYSIGRLTDIHYARGKRVNDRNRNLQHHYLRLSLEAAGGVYARVSVRSVVC
jgi:hypothetical protein